VVIVLIGNSWDTIYKQTRKKSITPTLTDRDYRMVSTPSGFLELGYYQNRKVSLFDFQRSYIDDSSRFIAVAKSRQLGHSEIGIAGCAIAKSHLFPPLTSIITSYNLRECKEKITKALTFHEGIHPSLRSPISRDNAFEINFKNGSRIISLFSSRGFAKSDVYMDEISFYENQQKAYNDASAVIAWDEGRQIRIGGTPFGKGGLYYDIIMGTDGKFPNFSRHFWFWWDCPLYCNNVELARKEAHMMCTYDRVKKFGTQVIKNFFNNMFLEDFQQEFEICFNDTELSYFPYDLIVGTMTSFDLADQQNFPESMEKISDVNQGILYAGYDVGRTKDAAEFYVLDLRNIDKRGKNRSVLREVFHESLQDMSFADQKARLIRFIDMYSSTLGGLYIDMTGIGYNLAEDLTALYPGKVQGIYFTSENRSQMISTTKTFMLDDLLQLMPCRDLTAHFYSIKKHVTTAGNMVFVVEKSKHHHADKFWAVALACLAARGVIEIRPEIFTFGENWDYMPEIDLLTHFN